MGLKKGTYHAWFFANDNSPGFASETFTLEGDFLRVPKIAFIAGWSDGRKDPPERLKGLSERLKRAGLRPLKLLGVDESLPMGKLQAEVKGLLGEVGRLVEGADGEKVTVGDLVAIWSYENLKNGGRKK